MDKTIARDLNFRLQFDDPRLPEERKILIRGNQEELEVLCNIVTSYVQQLLQQSAEDFSINLSDSDSANISSESELKDDPPSIPSIFPTQPISSFNTQSSQAKIYLEPSNNLTHKLFLGSLANQTSGPVIELSLLQLFDLATALDEYSSDMIALPTFSPQTSQSSLPQWVPIAAVLAIAAGLTPFTWQYANNVQQSQKQVAKNNSPEETQVAIEPSFPNATQTPTLNLTPPPTQLTPPLPNFNTPPAPLAFPNATIPASPQPALTIPSDTSSFPTTSQIPLPAIVPNPAPNSPSIVARSRINTTKPQNLPRANSNISPNFSTLPQSIATIPNNNLSNTPNNLPSSSVELQPGTVGISNPDQAFLENNKDSLIRRLKTATNTSSVTQVARDQTLFDTPQVAEAREYLNKRWQPPTGLSQALEYSLTLGVDGTIERILPLNQVAREYIDNSGLPEIGKPFVSTNKSGQSLRIRVVLGHDRKVQTFPETP
jgi:hypothetical protein